MSKAPDQALRRMVADLADMRPSDIEAILADLEPNQQDRVRVLMAQLRGRAPVEQAQIADEIWNPVLAPWLLERLAETPDDGALSLRSPRAAMTDGARAALFQAGLAAGARIAAPKPLTTPAAPRTKGLPRLAKLLGRGWR